MTELILHFPPGRPWGMPNMSPFCSKLECYLRMAEIPYTIQVAKFRKAPKGKIPFATLDGSLIGDSQLIIEQLERRAGAAALDVDLAPRDRAIGHAAQRMLDEAFYFVIVYLRWAHDTGYALLAPEFKKLLPRMLRVVLPLIRRDVRKSLYRQGTGRHSYDEVVAMGVADVDAIAELLGDRPFLLGDRPRTVDASVFAFVDAILAFPAESAVRRRAAEHARLVAYRQRIRDRWWKDLPA